MLDNPKRERFTSSAILWMVIANVLVIIGVAILVLSQCR